MSEKTLITLLALLCISLSTGGPLRASVIEEKQFRHPDLSGLAGYDSLDLVHVHRWDDVRLSAEPRLTMDEATAAARAYCGCDNGVWEPAELVAVAVSSPPRPRHSYRPAWWIRLLVDGPPSRWQMLIDAHDGEVLAFEEDARIVLRSHVQVGNEFPQVERKTSGLDLDAAQLTLLTGDGDPYLDNCERARMSFDVVNTGTGTLTNVEIMSVTPTSHPLIRILTSFPQAVSPTLAEGERGAASFELDADGLSFQDTAAFRVEVTADEIAPAVISADLFVTSTASDREFFATTTFNFEQDDERWQVVEGFFDRSSGGGAQATSWFQASSSFQDDQCDHVRSPLLWLSATSTLSLWTQRDIEPSTGGVWGDRANLGLHKEANDERTLVHPDGGRGYNATGAGGTCATDGQNGWAGAATTWGESTWSASALGAVGLAGQPVRLDARYGTDAAINGFGFHFDEVTVSDVERLVPDEDVCEWCASDLDCDDTLSCTHDSCDLSIDQCEHTPDDALCVDGSFCNGEETCDVDLGCRPGTPPDCDDGVFCTLDICHEGLDECQSGAWNARCNNGLFCDGVETCDAVLDCQPGTPPCVDGVHCTVDTCDEAADTCDYSPDDALCDNGLFCDGVETCDATLGCQAGAAVECPVDGIDCTVDACNEESDACENAPDDGFCDNATFCDGAEICDAALGCLDGPPPCDDGLDCTSDSCDEDGDSCAHSADDTFCDDSRFCNGVETCDPTLGCQAGVAPDCDDGVFCTLEICHEVLDECQSAPWNARCDNGLFCDGAETCDPELDCQPGTPPCDDNVFCNGAEICDEAADTCQAGPPACDDGIDCTADTCDEAAASCGHAPDDTLCADSRFCNGVEFCDAALGCQPGTPPDCSDGVPCTLDICNEGLGQCESGPLNSRCNNGIFCDGVETCDPVLDCQPGTPPCNDGVDCTIDTCDEAADTCANAPDHTLCIDNVFCDGAELCNPAVGCEGGTDPCPNQLCDEAGDACVGCVSDADCGDGIACNGTETCIGGFCQAQGQGGPCLASDDFEDGNEGWMAGGACSTGSFVVGSPDLVVTGGITTQPGGDHTSGGGNAFFTAPNANGVGTDDVDGGECVATSPIYVLTADSDVSIWYFHGQRDAGDDPTGDYFELEVAINGAWTSLVSLGDVQSEAAWTPVTATANAGDTVQIRLRVADGISAGDIIEAGLDDVSICDR